MYDVPPPNELEGLEAYRQSWAPFFDSFRRGGVFEIVKLNVTAGDRVAYATALPRCGTKEELARDTITRLRLTVGLRKIDGRWCIAHEHHSFPLSAT
jgi:ketosteroid isomerase-like protein